MSRYLVLTLAALCAAACSIKPLEDGETTADLKLFSASGPVREIIFHCGVESLGSLSDSLHTEHVWFSMRGKLDSRLNDDCSELRHRIKALGESPFTLLRDIKDYHGNWIMRILSDSLGRTVTQTRELRYWVNREEMISRVGVDEDVDHYISPGRFNLRNADVRQRTELLMDSVSFSRIMMLDSPEAETSQAGDYYVYQSEESPLDQGSFRIFYDSRENILSLELISGSNTLRVSEAEEFPFEKLQHSGFSFK